MAVKASAQITISKVIDIHACYRYYKLQSSTLAKPSKPTTNPPSGWSDTEPAYASGSTNTLYFVDCNVYSDKTFNFSEVSVSSSYEAAKAAWNKAKNAQDTANSANGKIDELQVGGRNMLLGSSFDNLPQVDNTYTKYSNNSVKLVVDNTDGTTTKYVSISSLKQSWSLSDVIGKTITISMWIYIEKVGQLSGYEFRVIYTNKGATKLFEPDTRYPYYIPNASSLSSGWNYVYGSFTIPDDSTRAEFNFTCYATAGKSGYAWFSSPKAEIGNKPTDWTPSPSDAIKDVDVEYYLSTSATSLSGGSWSTTAPTWVNGKYMWSRTVTVDGAGNKTYSPSQNGVCIAGAQGNTGASGKDAIIISSTPPENPVLNQLWQTESGQPIKRWNGSKWVLHYLSVDNLNAEKLSAICADLGIVTAGVLKSPEDSKNQTFMVIDLSQASLISYVADENRSTHIKDGQILLKAKDEGTDLIECAISGTCLKVTDTGTKDSTGLAFDGGCISIWNSADNKNGDNRHIDIYDTLKNLVDGDYIVSKGTSGIWGYRKWNSGIAEVWCKYETVTANLYGIGLTVGTPYYPFNFIVDPIINASFGVDSTADAGIRYVYTNCEYAQMYGWCKHSGVKCWFYVYGIGKWK